MRQATVTVISTALLLTSCGDREVHQGGASIRSLDDITTRAARFDGQEIVVKAAYYSSFEVSVLTSGFAESFPPQPIGPLVWVAVGAPAECLERGAGATWAARIVATGDFRFEPRGGLGHLGRYRMALENARLTCR